MKNELAEINLDYSDICFKNNGKLKLLIIVGTRPEVIRLSTVIVKCRKYFDCILAHTGQNYDYNLNGIFFEEMNIGEPDVYMNTVGDDLGSTCGNIINCAYKLIVTIRPDALLILGDTNSCLSAIAAKRLHVPIFHMEAGNRCKDELLPEETNRRIVDIISDINMAYSEHARKYLHECGIPKERIFVVGSPMPEVLHNHMNNILTSNILTKLELTPKEYALLSVHREENIDCDDVFRSLFDAINAMAEKYNMKILYSCHPRSRKKIEESGIVLDRRIIIHEPLGFFDYNYLQLNSYVVISDSGTLPEECAFYAANGYSFAAVSVRTSTERPEAMDKAGFVLAGTGKQSILQAVQLAVEMQKDGEKTTSVYDYEDENTSTKVVKIVQSYTSIVNKFVWRKYQD